MSNLPERTSDLYFAADPGRNRQYGRTDLVFDHWLYPVFESVHGAEPRSSWLRSALYGRVGPIRHHDLQRSTDRRARGATDQARVCPAVRGWVALRLGADTSGTVPRRVMCVRGASSAELAVEIEHAND